MNALLEMPDVRQRVLPLSVKEYHALGEIHDHGRRSELIRGIVLQSMQKSPLHRFFTEKLRSILIAQIPAGRVVFSQDPLTTADSEPEPDLLIVQGAPEDFRFQHPSTGELVVEIAISTLEIDRLKADIYAEAGVREYWIVCPESRRVEVFRLPGEHGYADSSVMTEPAVLTSVVLPGVEIDLASLFA